MRTVRIIVRTPVLDLLLHVIEAQEPALVPALRPQTTVERLDEPIVCGLSASAEVQTHAVQVRLLVQPLTGELGAIINADLLRQSTVLAPYAVADEPLADLDHQALTREVIDQRQEAELPAIEELVGHEVHAPALVRTQGLDRLRPGHRAAMSPWLMPPHAESFLPVEPVHALAVHTLPLTPQLRPHPLVSPRRVRGSDLLDLALERRLIVFHRVVPLRRACLREHMARPTLAHPVHHACLLHHGTPTIRRQSFPLRASCRI